MQLPENSDTSDIREAFNSLQKEVDLLRRRIERLEANRKKSDYESGFPSGNTERMARTSIRVIIGTAIFVVLLNWISAILLAIKTASGSN